MEISPALKAKINVWKNEIKDIPRHDDNLKWILNHHKLIFKFINEKYTNLNTLRSHISALTSIIKALRGQNSHLYKKYSKEAIRVQKIIESEQSNQTVSDNRKERYFTFDAIEQRREHFKKLFQADPTNNKLNLQYLVLCLYTYQPPLRMDYKDMLIVDNVPNKKDNFILKQNNKYFVVIQNDKVIRTHKSAIFELNHTLSAIIDESLKFYPRRYILSLITNPNKPIGAQNFITLLHSCFNGSKIGVDILRSLYVTHKYNNHNFSVKEKQELARLMRTSVNMSMNIYHKITNISDLDLFVNKICPDVEKRELLKVEIQKVIDAICGTDETTI